MRAGRNTRQTFERVSGPPAVPLLITDGVEVTDSGLWVWLRIPTGSTWLLEDREAEDATLEVSASLGDLLPPGADYHIKVMWSRHHGEDYRASWDRLDTVRAPGAADYIELGADRIDRNTADGHFRRREVLLGLRWPDGGAGGSTVERASALARRNLRSARRQVGDARELLARSQVAIDRWIASMARGPLAAEAAPAGLIAWAYAREMRRVAVDVPDETQLGGPALVGLMHGQMDPRESPNYVVVTDAKTGHRSYVTVLVPAVNGFPTDELEIPGGEWLEMLTELPDVEASVRGVNHGQRGSIELIDAGRKRTRSQAREAGQNGNQVPAEVAAADEALNARRVEVTRRLDVETTNHARWIVTADDPDQLADRIAEVRQRYVGIVKLEVASYVQGLLWQELLPGDQVRVPEFGADQPMRTLAGSWFAGGSAVGDQTGPYIGGNRGSTSGPVQAHVVSRSDENKGRPTSIAVVGRSGEGKSNAVELMTLGGLAEAAWALLVDPKGDLAGIVDVAADLLGVPVQVIDALDPAAAGTMDPMRFTHSADDARTMTLDAMLGALAPADRHRGEVLLESAIDTVLRQPRQAWSAPAVIGTLLSTPDTNPGAETARELGNTLTLRARQAHMRAVLGPLAENAQPMMTGRGLVYLSLAGLDLPRHNPDPDKWSVSERCAMATFRVSLQYALQQSRQVRSLKKLVALTELHLITGYPEGRAFVEWLARTGRALQLWQLLDTQAASDLAELPSLLEQLVMTFAFAAETDAEQRAQAAMLRRPDAGPRLREAMAGLRTGEAIMRDRYGRLSIVAFDRLTTWIAATLATDAEEDSADTPNTEPANTEPANVDDDAPGHETDAENTSGAGQGAVASGAGRGGGRDDGAHDGPNGLDDEPVTQSMAGAEGRR